jgi:hypothetical protein
VLHGKFLRESLADESNNIQQILLQDEGSEMRICGATILLIYHRDFVGFAG